MQMMIAAKIEKFLLQNSIGEMGAVPCQKVIHLMNDCRTKMRSIGSSPCRKLEELNQLILQNSEISWNVECRDTLQCSKPLPGH